MCVRFLLDILLFFFYPVLLKDSLLLGDMSVTSTVQQQGDRMPMNGHTMRSPLLPPPPPVLQRSNNNDDDPMRTSTTTTTKTTLDGGVSYAQQHLGISLSDG